jgi:hypothetical protein
MALFNHLSLKLALWLVDKCLPVSIKDDVAGDLSEEFSDAAESKRHFKLWQQTLGVCWQYALRNKAFVQSFGVTLFTIVISSVLIHAVLVLSFVDDPVLYSRAYWENGKIHQLFFDKTFWSLVMQEGAYPFGVNALIDGWSYTWAITCLFAINLLSQKITITMKGYLWLTLVACTLPYAFGVYNFQYSELTRMEIGPIIAFMWISILYILVPMSVVIIRALYRQSTVPHDYNGTAR